MSKRTKSFIEKNCRTEKVPALFGTTATSFLKNTMNTHKRAANLNFLINFQELELFIAYTERKSCWKQYCTVQDQHGQMPFSMHTVLIGCPGGLCSAGGCFSIERANNHGKSVGHQTIGGHPPIARVQSTERNNNTTKKKHQELSELQNSGRDVANCARRNMTERPEQLCRTSNSSVSLDPENPKYDKQRGKESKSKNFR